MPWLYRIVWSLAIIFFILAVVVFSIWAVIIGAVLYALYRVYLYFAQKKGIGHGRAGQSRRVYYKVYTNHQGPGQSAGQHPPRGFADGEVIDMPVEEVTDSRSAFPKE
ncbi:hypothetical protein Desde_0923 [Desulfitobacterium dehalogenans ATCC 51507]|uniref:Uncharacterized protein n=1 Tax=Desulfitobacterium dehalogenans (strain ATCC 51507 / DSM 9161 / JW/IU-DC1) TaxID=756499 RepID=I4A5X5_DESDJ|nr:MULTISPECIES: hypothetical protein [Desulfitobacterium]AFL99359.1 hypothetical protein Desde_0923 [Desulfitobacterium dehalogenans ATCC 51507]